MLWLTHLRFTVSLLTRWHFDIRFAWLCTLKTRRRPCVRLPAQVLRKLTATQTVVFPTKRWYRGRLVTRARTHTCRLVCYNFTSPPLNALRIHRMSMDCIADRRTAATIGNTVSLKAGWDYQVEECASCHSCCPVFETRDEGVGAAV
jgi:hypothetical protein